MFGLGMKKYNNIFESVKKIIGKRPCGKINDPSVSYWSEMFRLFEHILFPNIFSDTQISYPL